MAKADGFLARHPETWPNRFKPFSDQLYHPLYQQSYPLTRDEQGQGFPPSATGIQFLAFNSAWAIDQTDRKRAGLYEAAVLTGIEAANRHTLSAPEGKFPLRIAIWHHAMMHVDGIKMEHVVKHLTKAGVRLVLHGDVHEANPAANPFQWPGLLVLGGGAFGARATDRVESMPQMYQIIELVPGNGPGGFERVRVSTRARPRAGGPWGPADIWPDSNGRGKVAVIEIDLKTNAPVKH